MTSLEAENSCVYADVQLSPLVSQSRHLWSLWRRPQRSRLGVATVSFKARKSWI